MTTIIDPAGTPTVVFNRSGTSIVSLVYSGSIVSIPHYSGVTVVLASWDGNVDHLDQQGFCTFQMSSDFEVGDLVEFHWNGAGPNGSSSPNVKDENGNTIVNGTGIMRKISNGMGHNWVALT